MKRLVIILDTLRRDVAKEILAPAFAEAKFHEIEAIGACTITCFPHFAKAINEFKGHKAIVTGGGFAGAFFGKYKYDYNNATTMFPLFKAGVLPDLDKQKGNTLLVVHDYYIHNYFDDVGKSKPISWVGGISDDRKEELFEAYHQRTRECIPRIQMLLGRFKGWEVYITTDHGEAFWERDERYHHGRMSQKVIEKKGLVEVFETVPEVNDIFIMDFQSRDKVTQLEVLRGK